MCCAQMKSRIRSRGLSRSTACRRIEEKTGKPVISSENAESMLMGSVVTEMIEKLSDDK